MARATKEESEKTAQQILEIATDHFRQRGYGGTDLVTVASDSGVTRGAIYHHFASKKALFEAVVSGLHKQLQDRIEREAASHDDLWEQLVAGCEACIDAALDPAVRQILLVEAPAVLGWEAWRSMDEATSFASLTDVLKQLAAAGDIVETNIDAAARLLSGAMNEAVLWIASAEQPEHARSQAIETLAMMVRSLKRSSDSA